MTATFQAAEIDRWPDLMRLFEYRGNPGYCWCMRWRVPGKEFSGLTTEGRKAALNRRIRDGEPVGILGYVAGEPAGWCSIAPRETYEALERSRVLRRVDDQLVWSVVCFFVGRRFRGRGLSTGLLRAAVAFAQARGATVVEGYPVEPEATSYQWMGLLATFRSVGFRDVGVTAGGRHIMRYRIDRLGESEVDR